MYFAQLHSWDDPSEAQIKSFETLDELYDYLQEYDLEMAHIFATNEDEVCHLDERFSAYCTFAEGECSLIEVEPEPIFSDVVREYDDGIPF